MAEYDYEDELKRYARGAGRLRKPVGWRTTLVAAMVIAVVAVGAGVSSYWVFGFNIRASATCRVTSIGPPDTGGRATTWPVHSSCGENDVYGGDFFPHEDDAQLLAESLTPGETYTFTLAGTQRHIIAATPVPAPTN